MGVLCDVPQKEEDLDLLEIGVKPKKTISQPAQDLDDLYPEPAPIKKVNTVAENKQKAQNPYKDMKT